MLSNCCSRPYSQEFGSSVIDPRSYYWLHNFIYDGQQQQKAHNLEKQEQQQQREAHHCNHHQQQQQQQEDAVGNPDVTGPLEHGIAAEPALQESTAAVAAAANNSPLAAAATGVAAAAIPPPSPTLAALPTLSLISTWFQNPDYLLQERPWVQTPLLVNNIDAAVAANALYGITSALLLRPESYLNPSTGQLPPEVRGLVRNTTDMLLWVVESRVVVERADLVLLYYPTRWPFYGFLARWYKLLKRNEPQGREGMPGTAIKTSTMSSGDAAAGGNAGGGASGGGREQGSNEIQEHAVTSGGGSTGWKQQQEQKLQLDGLDRQAKPLSGSGNERGSSSSSSTRASSTPSRRTAVHSSGRRTMKTSCPGPFHSTSSSTADPSMPATVPLPSEFYYALSGLHKVLRGAATEQLLKGAQQLQPGGRYWVWDGFVGNGDTSWGKPAPVYEDRVWATAVALNALIDIWSEEGTAVTGK